MKWGVKMKYVLKASAIAMTISTLILGALYLIKGVQPEYAEMSMCICVMVWSMFCYARQDKKENYGHS